MKKGFTLIELVILIAVVFISIFILILCGQRYIRNSIQFKCKTNLKQIGIATHLYRDSKPWLPHANGASFICTFYISEVLTDSNCLICPATNDNNDKGKLITDENLVNGDSKNICSYAGRLNSNPDKYPGLFTYRNSSLTTIGSDDWGPGQGDLDYNHLDVVLFLYMDGHAGEPIDKSLKVTINFLTDPLGN